VLRKAHNKGAAVVPSLIRIPDSRSDCRKPSSGRGQATAIISHINTNLRWVGRTTVGLSI